MLTSTQHLIVTKPHVESISSMSVSDLEYAYIPSLGTSSSFHSSLSPPFFCLEFLHFTVCPFHRYLPRTFDFLAGLPLLKKCKWQNQYVWQHHHSAFVFSFSLLNVSRCTLSNSGQEFQLPFWVCIVPDAVGPHAWTSACTTLVIMVIFLIMSGRSV